MKRNFVIVLLILSSFIFSQTIVEWTTSMGNFKAELREDLVPITANNFIDLTNQNFYDNLIFHRVIDDFMIQDGCPNGNGYGGPGYSIPDEFHPDHLHDSAGVLSMANAGPNTGGSQYFITLVQTSWLDTLHSSFGNIIEGLDIVQNIGDVPVDANNRPITPVNIDSIRVLTPQIDSFNPEETEMSVELNEMITFVVISFDDNVTYSWYINDELQTETSFIYFYTFPLDAVYEVKCIISNGSGYDYEIEWIVSAGEVNTNDESIPNEILKLSNFPNPFNPSTTISFSISDDTENMELIIYNLKGQKVKQFSSRSHPEFIEGSIIWNGTDENNQPVSSGLYLYKLISNGKVIDTKKMLMLK